MTIIESTANLDLKGLVSERASAEIRFRKARARASRLARACETRDLTELNKARKSAIENGQEMDAAYSRLRAIDESIALKRDRAARRASV